MRKHKGEMVGTNTGDSRTNIGGAWYVKVRKGGVRGVVRV